MKDILETKDRIELESLIRLVRGRGMRGRLGTWEEFLKYRDPLFGFSLTSPALYEKPDFISFLCEFRKKEDQELLLAWLRSPLRGLAYQLSRNNPDESDLQRLVRLTHTRDDHPLDYFLSPQYNPVDWVFTRFVTINPYPRKVDMLAVCCDTCLCEDGSETVVRVAVVDGHFKVVLDEFLKPNRPVADYRTSVTGITAKHLKNAAYLPVIQDKLQTLLSLETVIVGHFLNQDLNALKFDHANKIDTSLVFKYEYSGGLGEQPRPSFDHLCKSILGYQVQRAPHKAEAAMKLVLAIVESGVSTFVPLTEDIKLFMRLKADKAKKQKRPYPEEEEESASSKKPKEGKKASCKKLRREKEASTDEAAGLTPIKTATGQNDTVLSNTETGLHKQRPSQQKSILMFKPKLTVKPITICSNKQRLSSQMLPPTQSKEGSGEKELSQKLLQKKKEETSCQIKLTNRFGVLDNDAET